MEHQTSHRTFLASDAVACVLKPVDLPQQCDGDKGLQLKILAAWLDKSVSEAEAEALSLQRICGKLRSEWQILDYRLAEACEQMEASVTQLDFGLLRPTGCLSRFMGVDKEFQVRFLRQWDEIEAAGASFRATCRDFIRKHRARQSKVKKDVLSLQWESRRLKDTLDLAIRCLNLLSAEISAQGNSDDIINELARQAQNRLELLCLINSAMLGVPESFEGAFVRGDNVIKLLESAWAQELTKWQANMRDLEERVVKEEHSYERLKDHANLRSRMRGLILHLAASCAAFKRQEGYLINGLAAIAGEPDPAG